MSTAALTYYTPEEYLALERRAEFRSEYIDGRIVAMTGGSIQHARIVFGLQTALDRQLSGGSCEVINGEVRVRIDTGNRYVYPDATVVCGPPEFQDGVHDTLMNPTVVFEVLSPGTEAYDRGEKSNSYRRIPTLREYVLISQDRVSVECFRRHGDFWVIDPALEELDAVLELGSLGCSIPVREIYARVQLGPSA